MATYVVSGNTGLLTRVNVSSHVHDVLRMNHLLVYPDVIGEMAANRWSAYHPTYGDICRVINPVQVST